MELFRKKNNGKRGINHLYVIDMGETWLLQWQKSGNTVKINACIRFEGEIPMPRKDYEEEHNSNFTNTFFEFIEKAKVLSEMI